MMLERNGLPKNGSDKLQKECKKEFKEPKSKSTDYQKMMAALKIKIEQDTFNNPYQLISYQSYEEIRCCSGIQEQKSNALI